MNNKAFAYAGAAALVIGLFTPVVRLPLLGSVDLFNNGTSLIALSLLALAAIAAGLTLKDRERDIIWPGGVAAVVLASQFLKLQLMILQMRESLSKSLDGNPFAGIAQAALGSVQIQWGWMVLAAGAGLLIYIGLAARRTSGTPIFRIEDRPAQGVIAASVIILIIALCLQWFGGFGTQKVAPEPSPVTSSSDSSGPSATSESTPSPEEAAYIAKNIKLYDFKAKYYDSELDGRVPGVDFKIKNIGDRTLNEVDVKVIFYDASNKPIGEEDYTPVLVSDYSFGDEDKPLRPNYIWQNDSGNFYSAKDIPSEWKEGKATAMITKVVFAPK